MKEKRCETDCKMWRWKPLSTSLNPRNSQSIKVSVTIIAAFNYQLSCNGVLFISVESLAGEILTCTPRNIYAEPSDHKYTVACNGIFPCNLTLQCRLVGIPLLYDVWRPVHVSQSVDSSIYLIMGWAVGRDNCRICDQSRYPLGACTYIYCKAARQVWPDSRTAKIY